MFYVKSLLLYTSHSSAHLLYTVGGLYVLAYTLFSKYLHVRQGDVCTVSSWILIFLSFYGRDTTILCRAYAKVSVESKERRFY